MQMQMVQSSQRYWSPSLGMSHYFRIGGSVSALVEAVFELAIEGDKYQGSGDFERRFVREIAELPECGNDHEFGFAWRTFIQLESLCPAFCAR